MRTGRRGIQETGRNTVMARMTGLTHSTVWLELPRVQVLENFSEVHQLEQDYNADKATSN